MNGTLGCYDSNSRDITRTYEGVDFHGVIDSLTKDSRPGSRVLDVGCGSGRDAAYLLGRGFDVQAIDGSTGMLREAASLHPELESRLHHVVLPAVLPFGDAAFDVVTAWAMLMHFNEPQLPRLFRELSRVLKPDGLLGYSVSVVRPGLDDEGRDDRGRYFTCLDAATWEQLHLSAGFRTISLKMSDDVTGRPGFRWATFFVTR